MLTPKNNSYKNPKLIMITIKNILTQLQNKDLVKSCMKIYRKDRIFKKKMIDHKLRPLYTMHSSIQTKKNKMQKTK